MKRELKATLLLQGEMEQALENYDVCTEMLQHSAAMEAVPDSDKRVVIRLPNLHVDSVVSLEEVTSSGGGFLSSCLLQAILITSPSQLVSHQVF